MCSSLINGINMTSASRADNSGPTEAAALYPTLLMPSIRIKSQLYSPLNDSLQPEDEQENDLTRPELHHQSSLPAIREDALSPPPGEFLGPSFRRQRGSTVSSGRITDHIWRNSRPLPSFDPPGSATSPTSSPSLSAASPRLGVNSPVEMRTVDGHQAGLRIPSPTQGLVEHSIHDDKEQHSSDGDDHHHDDVVEHLDVIGGWSASRSLSLWLMETMQTLRLPLYLI